MTLPAATLTALIALVVAILAADAFAWYSLLWFFPVFG